MSVELSNVLVVELDMDEIKCRCVLDVAFVKFVALAREDEAPVEAEFDDDEELDEGETALLGISIASKLLKCTEFAEGKRMLNKYVL